MTEHEKTILTDLQIASNLMRSDERLPGCTAGDVARISGRDRNAVRRVLYRLAERGVVVLWKYRQLALFFCEAKDVVAHVDELRKNMEAGGFPASREQLVQVAKAEGWLSQHAEVEVGDEDQVSEVQAD